MAEEVKILVKQEAQGTALKDAQREAEALQKTQSTPNRDELGRFVAGDHKAAARLPGERLEGEKKVTNELREQHAVMKAQVGHGMGSARMIGEMLDMTSGSQGWVYRAMMLQRAPHMLAALAASPAAVGVAAAALPIGAYAGYSVGQYNEGQKDLSFTNWKAEELGRFTRQGARERTHGAGSEALMGEGEQLREQAAALRGQRAELERKQAGSVSGLIDSVFGTSFSKKGVFGAKTDSQRAIDENEEKAAQFDKEAASKERQRKERFKTDGALDIGIDEATQRYDMRTVRRLQDEKKWLSTYYKVKGELGEEGKTAEGEATATRAADVAMNLQQRDRGLQFAHLVNARSGRGDIARAASLAAAAMGGDSHLLGHKLDHLRRDVNTNHRDGALGQLKVWEE